MTDTDELVIQRRDQDRTDATVVRRQRVFDLARPVGLAIGVLFTVLGAVTLVRTGVGASLTSPHVVVGWFHHTPLWGLIELVLGVGLLAAAAVERPDRNGIAGFGVFAAVFGLIVLIEPDAFHGSLGIHSDTGWLFLVIGIVSALAGWYSPLTWGSDR